MRRVVRVVQFDFRTPTRRQFSNGKMLLVALFPDDKILVAFANHLYHKHDVLTVDDWDSRGRQHLESYPMDIRSKRRFLKLIGTPSPASTNAAVLPMAFTPARALS